MEKKHLSQSLAPMKHDLGILRKDGDDKYLLSLFKRGGVYNGLNEYCIILVGITVGFGLF